MELFLDATPPMRRTRPIQRASRSSSDDKRSRDRRTQALLERVAELYGTIQAVLKAYIALPSHNPAHFNSLKSFQRRAGETWWLMSEAAEGTEPPKGLNRCTLKLAEKQLAESEKLALVASLETDWKRSDVCAAWFGPTAASVIALTKARGRTRSGALEQLPTPRRHGVTPE